MFKNHKVDNFNRFRLVIAMDRRNRLLIEPKWNVNIIVDRIIFAMLNTFNRTKMEFKDCFIKIIPSLFAFLIGLTGVNNCRLK